MKEYIYLDKAHAKKGIVLSYGTFPTPIPNYEKYFGEVEVVEFCGFVPHAIFYDEATNKIREATKKELYDRGEYILAGDEAVVDGKIVTFDSTTQIPTEEGIRERTRQDDINAGMVTLESELAKARAQRKKDFVALDIYEKNVLFGRNEATEETRAEVDQFMEDWKTLPDRYTDLTNPVEDMYPSRPIFIDYFYQD